MYDNTANAVNDKAPVKWLYVALALLSSLLAAAYWYFFELGCRRMGIDVTQCEDPSVVGALMWAVPAGAVGVALAGAIHFAFFLDRRQRRRDDRPTADGSLYDSP